MNLIDTLAGSLLEGFFPKGWDLERMDACCSHPPEAIVDRQDFWHHDFTVTPCDTLQDFNVKMGHEIALEIARTKQAGKPLALILPVGPLGMYPWVVYFLKTWGVDARHVYTFNMDEWSDRDGNIIDPANPGSFYHAMQTWLFNPLGEFTVPESQRHFATKETLPAYPQKIAALKQQGADLVMVYGIGRVYHIAFWEPHFAAEFANEEEWKAQTFRLGAQLHPLTIEQNAILGFKSRITAVPCRANTIGPGLFLQADRTIGGCEGIFGREMHWQGMALWVTLRYRPDMWVPSSFIPTLPGKFFFLQELAGPLAAG